MQVIDAVQIGLAAGDLRERPGGGPPIPGENALLPLQVVARVRYAGIRGRGEFPFVPVRQTACRTSQ